MVDGGSPLFPVGRIKPSDITAFLRQLLMLVDSGTPLVKGLRTLSERTGNTNLRTLISEVCSYVEAGNPLWQALEQYPKYFSPVFVNLVKAGEASGTVPVVLRRLIEFRDRSQATRRKVKSALVYPAIVIVAAVGFLFVVSKFVVPAFQEMFEEVGIEIPAVTQCVIGTANLIGNYWILWLALVVGAAVLYKMYAATPGGRVAVDRLKLRIPGFGRLLTSATVTEFTRTFALLLRSGVSILVTLDLTKDSMPNRAFGESLKDVRDAIERGEGLEVPLRNNDMLPAIVTDMLVTGEESGTLDDISEKVADIYQEDLDIAVETLSGLIEPVLALLMGGVVLILVLTLFLPYVSMLDQISGAGL
jgi:type IV pilus assembly protein PilC